MTGLLEHGLKRSDKSARRRGVGLLARLMLLVFFSSRGLSAGADAGIFASAKQRKGFSGYTGLGYSGSNFGRQIPGLHFSLGYQLFETSFFTSGTSSQNASTSHQNILFAAHARVYESQYFNLTNGIGLGVQHNTRVFNSRASGESSSGSEEIQSKETDSSFGPGFSVTACVFTFICLRMETLLGMHARFFEQIYHENALASIGVQL